MKQETYVISGIGLAIPLGCSLNDVYQNFFQSKQLFEPYEIFSHTSESYSVAHVDDKTLDHGLSLRQLKKLDRFTILSLAAVRRALEDAGIESNSEACKTIGIMVGNCTAGWKYVEPMMYPLYSEGMEAINSYVATAWFPAAPQGETSIHYGLGGHSKTISADSLSSGIAIKQSLNVLNNEHVDLMIAGGAESPFSNLVYNVFLQSGRLSSSEKYLPFNENANGTLLGEGAVFLSIESKHRAKERGVKIYAEISAIAHSISLADAMFNCIKSAGITSKDIDYILLDGAGDIALDEAEYVAIAEVFAANTQLFVSAPKSFYGELLGANVAASVAIGCLSLEKQTIFPTIGLGLDGIELPFSSKHIVDYPKAATLRHILINSRNSDGSSLVILLTKNNSSL